MAETSIPVRTCVGCRERAPANELLRVVAENGTLVPDPGRRRPGRGASVHPTPECLRAAERRRAFPRALRSSAPLEAGPLRAHVHGRSSGATAGAAPERAITVHTSTVHTSTEHERQTAVPRVGPPPRRSARREQDVVG